MFERRIARIKAVYERKARQVKSPLSHELTTEIFDTPLRKPKVFSAAAANEKRCKKTLFRRELQRAEAAGLKPAGDERHDRLFKRLKAYQNRRIESPCPDVSENKDKLPSVIKHCECNNEEPTGKLPKIVSRVKALPIVGKRKRKPKVTSFRVISVTQKVPQVKAFPAEATLAGLTLVDATKLKLFNMKPSKSREIMTSATKPAEKAFKLICGACRRVTDKVRHVYSRHFVNVFQ